MPPNKIPDALYHPDTNKIGAPVQASPWILPDNVWVHRRVIHWEAENVHLNQRAGKYTRRETRGNQDMLKDFVELSEARAERIAQYMYKWGPLEIRRKSEYELNQQGSRRKRTWCSFFDGYHVFKKPEAHWYLRGAEPIYMWRYRSSLFGAALRIGHALSESQRPADVDWARLMTFTASHRPLLESLFQHHEEPQKTRIIFHRVIQDWFSISGFKTSVALYESSNPILMEVSTPGLFAGLVQQLTGHIRTAWICLLQRLWQQIRTHALPTGESEKSLWKRVVRTCVPS